MIKSCEKYTHGCCCFRDRLTKCATLLILIVCAVFSIFGSVNQFQFFQTVYPNLRKSQLKPLILQYICSDYVCGGWGDRWKGAVFTYMLAKSQNRTFRMHWEGEFQLHQIFQPHQYLEKPQNVVCTKVNMIDQSNPPITWNSSTACISIRANIIPSTYVSGYVAASQELWKSLSLHSNLTTQLQNIEDGMRCAQIRNGKSKDFPDCDGCVGFSGDEERAKQYEEKIFNWLGKRKHTHLWTDSSAQEKRWLKFNPNAEVIDGPICHIDKNPSLACIQRVVMQWSLISKCKEIVTFSGFIESGLFMLSNTSKIVHL